MMSTARPWIRAANPAGWLLVVALIGLWQLTVDTGAITLDYLPAPTEVASAFGDVVSDGTLGPQLSHTLISAAIAAGAAAGIGVVLGTTIGLLKPVAALTSASIDFLRSIPAVSLMPVVLLTIGASAKSEIMVGIFAGVWPVLLSTIGGIQGINPRLHEVGRTLQLSERDRVLKILVPSAVPAILVGLRLTVVTSLVVVIIAEILINPEGIGWALSQAQQALRPDLLFAYAVVTGILGYLVNALLIAGFRLCMPGSPVLRGAA
jgi:sulfonate transport system permease protein